MSHVSDEYSVKVTTGVLVTCDSAAKQILLHVDGMRDGASKFIIHDVDETHVLVKGQYLEEIKDVLQEELEKNTYVQDQNV
ncbi:TFIIH subunit TTDA/Tfb5 [Papiliotrema laurentii]|uniref:General transcription and DNA repair factor IIH subunit TFB5 n=1 Tax=Papiliotrema laurentii TaxID=5418 RepID=A0AAD9CVV4_PAPLA|nr:TFIIH subunit TTDA/Tfb5 [Papiliotrema laurentii]